MTDSGGLQEETTILGVPCLTLRENTERPITIELGTNILAGNQPEGIMRVFKQLSESFVFGEGVAGRRKEFGRYCCRGGFYNGIDSFGW